MITTIVNLRCSPLEIVPHICGVYSSHFQEDGVGYRPNTVGDVLHCLTSKYFSCSVLAEAFHVFGLGLRVEQSLICLWHLGE